MAILRRFPSYSRFSRAGLRGFLPALLMLSGAFTNLLGQDSLFTPAATPSAFTGVRQASGAWGDYDNDGDLDVLITGSDSSGVPIARLYRNEGGNFVPLNAGFTGVSQGSVAWGDYDNDGDLDVLITGNAGDNTGVSKIYRNDGNGTFTDIAAGLAGVFRGAAAWGDYDNDGDLDILLTGSESSAPNGIAVIYRNDGGGIFTPDVSVNLPGVFNSSVAWGDFDGDGDWDILLSGTENGSSGISRIYRNDGGIFNDISAGLAGVFAGTAAWGDYDSDGDPDILLLGTPDGITGISKIYRNDGGVFSDVAAPLNGLFRGAAAWGDYDNDGDLDILLNGVVTDSSAVTLIYRNDAGVFVEILPNLPALFQSSAAWGDYDNDGVLDLLLAGTEMISLPVPPPVLVPSANVYRNLAGTPNAPPAAPAGLAASVAGRSVAFRWNRSGDPQTPPPGLTYNLRVGTSPGGGEIVSPMADPANGYRRIPALGNTHQDTSWTIGNLPPGDYFWSVQAIDNAFAGSVFAAEESFTIVNQPPAVANVIPNITLEIGESAFQRDLNAAPVVFSDPDGDPLSYSATSSDTLAALVQISGSVLTVTQRSVGVSEITVTADDGNGGTVSTSFTVTVIPGSVNFPPFVLNPIPAATLQIGGDPFSRDLEAAPLVFLDPERDPLGYSATSSDTLAALVQISGSVLTVTQRSVGVSEITVTADDGNGGTVSTSFTVTVIPGSVNFPPFVLNLIPGATLQIGGDPFTRDLEATPLVFLDPERDPLGYSATSSDTLAALVQISGSVLIVTQRSVGLSEVIVTADDSNGGTVSTSFTVTVIPGSVNFPPFVLNPIPGATLQIGGDPFTRDLEATPLVFLDPERDPLGYSATSSDTLAALVEISGSVLTVTQRSVGVAEITVAADDGNGGTASTSFAVTVIPGSVNFPPFVLNPIPGAVLQIGGDPFSRDLEATPLVFLDPERDPLSYSATSSDTLTALVQISGSLLTVTQRSVGAAEITVTADDGNGGTAFTSFTVTVIPGGGNQPPVVANAISNVTLEIGGSGFQRDLNAAPVVFSDPDGDPLGYSATSSDTLTALVQISGSLLTVTQRSVGAAEITVAADDGNGGTVSTSFTVTVIPGSVNFPPFVLNPIPAATLQIGGDPFTRDLEAAPLVFLDPERDPLGYSATSSDTLTALVQVSGSVLIVTQRSVGVSEITVTADDGNGGTAFTAFTVTVAPGSVNFPPFVLNPIPDAVLQIGGDPFTRDLEAAPLVFLDPERDPLGYSATSSDTLAALVQISGSVLTVAPLAAGSALITVAADDGNGGTAFTTFTVTIPAVNQPPLIVHTPVSLADAQTAIGVSAQVSDDSGISTVALHYRKGGEGQFREIPMAGSNDIYQAAIPADEVGSRGVEYFIRAQDLPGLVAREPASGYYSVQVRMAEPGIVKSTPQPGGSEQTVYRLISLPLAADNPTPAAVLEDDLGSYNVTQWRFFELAETQQYREFPNTGQMNPGEAFWLIVRSAGKFIDSGAGVTNRTSEWFAISLHPGWNFIGNPFNFDIPAAKLRLQSNDQVPELRYYEGGWNNPLERPVTTLAPFEGYAVFNQLTSAADFLLIDPDLSPAPLPRIASPGGENDLAWSIRILAQCQEARDVDNLAAVAAGASPGRDELDRPEPPVIGEYLSLYFPHPEWEAPVAGFCRDVRPEPVEGEAWEFEVRSNIRDRVQLTFQGVETVPATFEVWLVDEHLKISRNLRENNTFTLAATGENSPKRLSLVVGKAGYIEDRLAEAQAVPGGYELSQNFPNPFNPATTIRYGLPEEGRISLAIFDLLGREVITLIDNQRQAAGYHLAVWNGRDRNGAAATSGVYLYQLRAGNNRILKKMVLLK